MDQFGETPRGLQALRLLHEKRQLTLEGLRDAAYDNYQTAFARLIPGLVAAWDGAPASNPLKRRLEGPIAALRSWDHRWSAESVPTTLAMFWGEHLWAQVRKEGQPPMMPIDLIDALAPQRKLEALAAATDRLEREFGRWSVPWGEINRFQRLTGDIVQPHSDAAPSLPVPFTSGRWGSLASFGAAPRNGSKRWYGTSGNSFVAVVEFGDKIRALAVTAGGESGDPASPHFDDQAERYAAGDLREVYFYPEQLRAHTERTYRPGE
jgi:acyl-homoserine-lactone acylase